MSAIQATTSSEEGTEFSPFTQERLCGMEPHLPERRDSDSELRTSHVTNFEIYRNLSKSADNLCREDRSTTTAIVQLRDSRQRQQSTPLIDVCGCDTVSTGLDTTHNKKGWDTTSVGKRSRKESQILEEDQKGLLNLPLSGASGKDIHYDYVRASMILQLQRINNLKKSTARNIEKLVKVDDNDDYDSDGGGYVIEYQDEEPDQCEGVDDNIMPDSEDNPYVTLVETRDKTKEAKNSTESAVDLSGSPRPPLYLHKHPSVAELEVDSSDNSGNEDYEQIVTYEELGMGGEDDVEDPHLYDSIHQMRDRVTQMVQGKHRKKLKKFIIKRKSSEKWLLPGEATILDTYEPELSLTDPISENDSDSSGEQDSKIKSKFQAVADAPLDKSRIGRVTATTGKSRTHKALRRRHTCDDYLSQRQSLAKSEVLDKSQYDQMMEMMLNDQEVKQLQDAGVLKVKDIAELRAEIKLMVQSAPSVPPPLPGNARPRADHEKGKAGFKKWSSKSLHGNIGKY